jgi:hypothetical protein
MNLQQVMIKYTQLLAKKLYGVDDLKVEFPFQLTKGFSVNCGECKYHKNKTIKFNGILFGEYELDDRAWYIILHEITHIKILGHSKEFWLELRNNFEKTMELRDEFYRESNLNGDSYCDMDYTIHFDDFITLNYGEEIDYENLEDEDIFFSFYNLSKEFKDDF